MLLFLEIFFCIISHLLWKTVSPTLSLVSPPTWPARTRMCFYSVAFLDPVGLRIWAATMWITQQCPLHLTAQHSLSTLITAVGAEQKSGFSCVTEYLRCTLIRHMCQWDHAEDRCAGQMWKDMIRRLKKDRKLLKRVESAGCRFDGRLRDVNR